MAELGPNGEIAMSPSTSQTRPLRRLLLGLIAAGIAFAIAAACAPNARAYENVVPGFSEFDAWATDTTAGGHPDVVLKFTVSYDSISECDANCQFPRRYKIHWPEGFIGNPHVAPKCTISELAISSCPVDAQIGRFKVASGATRMFVPVYNLETQPHQAGLLGFIAPLIAVPIYFELSSRTDGDYGLDSITSPIQRLNFPEFETELWGVPHSPAHDFARFRSPLTGLGACYEGPWGPLEPGCPPGTGQAHVARTYATASSPEAPFLQIPTVCDAEDSVRGVVEFFGGLERSAETPWEPSTGCDQASFNPSVTAKPTTEATDSPSGIDAELKAPQTQSPVTPSPSQLRTARVRLPEGFSLNPGAAAGKALCPEVLGAIGTLMAAACPEHAKIGTLSVDVSALPGPVPGALYLVDSKPGERFRVLLAASGYATNIKLLGRVDTDPATGQVTFIFEDLPQSPLQEFDLHIFGAERGTLATPERCGQYDVVSEFVPWNSALNTRRSVSSITLTSGPDGAPCPQGPRPLAPALMAGSESNTAGARSPFAIKVDRPDGDQNLTGLTVSTPPGFSAVLAGIPYCPEAAIASLADPARTGHGERAAPACSPASQIGTATAAAGPGSRPVYADGKVYLAGPYKGAPLSLVIVLPAVAGPYDLGNVAVRTAIRVDPVTAQVTAVSDQLPRIVDGVPLRTRSIQVELNRPGFTLNPTNCSRYAVDMRVAGNEGAVAGGAIHYQAANCADLPFKPKLGLKLTGSTKRLGNPAVTATLRMNGGEANARRVSVVMPKYMLLDNSHISNVCSRTAFAAGNCPSGSVIGHAVAHTPLLGEPLRGTVYLRSSTKKLPDIVADLRGQVNVELVGRVFSRKGGRLAASFDRIPDVPVSRFMLKLQGGKRGLLVSSRSLCRGLGKASVKVIGQNGIRENRLTKIQTSCGRSAKKSSGRHDRRGR